MGILRNRGLFYNTLQEILYNYQNDEKNYTIKNFDIGL